MSLDSIFASIMPAVEEALVDAGVEGFTYAGPSNVDDTGRPPRITWIPIEAEQMSPRRTGGGPGDDGPILTRRWHLKVDVWGRDLENAEQLVDAFLAVAHDQLSQHSYMPGKEMWKVGGVTSDGMTCTMLFSIERPILRTAAKTATLRELRTTIGVGSPPATPVVSTFTKEE